jgi:hypothetical protein
VRRRRARERCAPIRSSTGIRVPDGAYSPLEAIDCGTASSLAARHRRRWPVSRFVSAKLRRRTAMDRVEHVLSAAQACRSGIAWRIRGEVDAFTSSFHVSNHVAAVCKTAVSALPATASRPCQSTPFRAGRGRTGMGTLISYPGRGGDRAAWDRRSGWLASADGGSGCSSVCSRDVVDRESGARRRETPRLPAQSRCWTIWTG